MLDIKTLEHERDLVIDRLIHLGGADYDNDKTGNELQRFGLVERDFGIEEWDWPQGIGLIGLDEAGGHEDFLINWFETNFKKGLPSRNINTTCPFLTLLHLARRHGDQRYMDECTRQVRFLMEELPRTSERGFQHVTSAVGSRDGVSLNEGQLWIDTVFMAVLFLAEYADLTADEECFNEALYQILLHVKYLYEKRNGLFYHGWSFLRDDNFGGVFWARGNSWFTLGMTRFLTQDRNFQIPRPIREDLEMMLKAQVKTLEGLQGPSGLWHTVLDDSGSYEEASATAAIASGIYRAVEAGLIDKHYSNVADKAMEGLMSCIKADGTVDKVSAGTAIGMDKEFYKNIIIRPMAYGQALTLLALNDALRSIQDRNSTKGDRLS